MNFKEKRAWQEVAKAPRKSYLGRVGNITPSQKRWVSAVLSMWGDELGGSCAPIGCTNIIGRLMVRTEWSENKGKSITATVNELYKLGYRGEELFKKAREIIIPKTSFRDLLKRAEERQEAEFIDSVIAKTFDKDNPVRVVAKMYYCNKRAISDITNYLASVGGVLMTEEQARWRVRWCLDIFNAKIYKAISYELAKEESTLAA